MGLLNWHLDSATRASGGAMGRDMDKKLSDALAAYAGERTARSEVLIQIEILEKRLEAANAEIGRLMMELKRLQENEHG